RNNSSCKTCIHGTIQQATSCLDRGNTKTEVADVDFQTLRTAASVEVSSNFDHMLNGFKNDRQWRPSGCIRAEHAYRIDLSAWCGAQKREFTGVRIQSVRCVGGYCTQERIAKTERAISRNQSRDKCSVTVVGRVREAFAVAHKVLAADQRVIPIEIRQSRTISRIDDRNNRPIPG